MNKVQEVRKIVGEKIIKINMHSLAFFSPPSKEKYIFIADKKWTGFCSQNKL